MARSHPKNAPRHRDAPRGSGAHADEVTGVIQFRTDGSAGVRPEGDAAGSIVIRIFPEDTGVALPGDRVRLRTVASPQAWNPDERTGRVLAVLERPRTMIVGDVRRAGRGLVVTADDPRFPREIEIRGGAKLEPAPTPGDKVAVRIGEWKQRHHPLTGEITERLGRTHEPRAEMRGVLVKFDLEEAFPPDVEREAAALPDAVAAADTEGRLDLREVPTVTIDPDDAKDFDDALSLEPLAEGRVRIGVHIADVSAYVRPGTALDTEAQRRGNSTYLVGTVIPMLPEKLSNGLCSLVEAQDRLCKSVLFTWSADGDLERTDFRNTVIRSRKRLTYRQAYALLFEKDTRRIRALPSPPRHQTASTGRPLAGLPEEELSELQDLVRQLWAVARRLRSRRMANGSLDLEMPETKVLVDEKGYAERLERVEHDESHQLIEEFMLAANEAVARLTRKNRLPSLYRVHDDPDEERLEEYRQFAATFGVKAGDLTKREEVVRLLESLRNHPQGYTLRSQFLRSLKRACYRAEADGHYGLAMDDYTHFTSPIRRYADLVVHRVIGAWIDSHADGARAPRLDAARAGKLAEHLSLTEQNSMEAERESVKIKQLEFFEREVDKRPRTVFEAVITDIRRTGLFVELVESMTFGVVPTAALRRNARELSVGDRLGVVVASVDRHRRFIDFLPAPVP